MTTVMARMDVMFISVGGIASIGKEIFPHHVRENIYERLVKVNKC